MGRERLAFFDDGLARLVECRAGNGERARAAGQSRRRAVGVAHDHVDAVGIDAELIRHNLLIRGEQTGAVFLVAHDQFDMAVLEFDRRGFGKTAAAAFGVGRHADAAQLAVALALPRAAWRTRPIPPRSCSGPSLSRTRRNRATAWSPRCRASPTAARN